MRKVLGIVLGVVFVFSVGVAEAQTVAELQALIKVLTEQIAQIEAQIAAKKSGIPAGGGSVACPALNRSLSNGISGEDVTSLQKFLAADVTVYPEGITSGYFGTLTERAVQRWQAKYGVVSAGTPESTGYGVVGPATRAAIARVCASAAPVIPATPATPSPVLRSCNLGSVLMAHNETRTFYLTGSVAFGATCQGTPRTCNDGTLGGNTSYGFASCTVPATGQSCLLPDGTQIAHGNTPTLYKKSVVLFGQTCAPFAQTRSCTNGILSGNAEYQFTNCSVSGPGACVVIASSTASTTVAHNSQGNFYSAETVPYTSSCANVQQTRVCTDGLISGSSAYKYNSCRVIPAKTCTLDNVTLAHGAKYKFFSDRTNNSTGEREQIVFDGGGGGGTSCDAIGQERTCTDGALSGSATYQYSVCAPAGQRWCLLDSKYTAHNNTAIYYSQNTVPFGNTCSQFSAQRTCTDGTLGGSSSYQYASCSASAPLSCTLDGKTVGHGSSDVFYSLNTPPTGESCAAYQQIRYCNDGVLSGSSGFNRQTCT